jgi:predicted  nucleic acid-binding Zn-ribbon protein
MLSSLASLIALQSIDSAADAARRRLVELPKALADIDARVGAATANVEAAKALLQESLTARRALEKDVAAVDTRLARFDDHKAAVKTNQEYTALLHEISTAKTDKDSLEERILVHMEEADQLTANVKAAEAELAAVKREGDATRAALSGEKKTVEGDLARLDAERADRRKTVEARPLAVYDQLLKGRRGVAVAQMSGEICTACHVRLRPHVTQSIRRNDEIVQCESCQRILYFAPQAPEAAAGQAT